MCVKSLELYTMAFKMLAIRLLLPSIINSCWLGVCFEAGITNLFEEVDRIATSSNAVPDVLSADFSSIALMSWWKNK